MVAKARRILNPYKLDVKEMPWWSVYEIGQRLTDKFDDVPEIEVATRLPSVFIAGDACHTHSPKAGQGMNVSMQDAFNLGWKLAAVLRGRCPPSLLHTYSAERRTIAGELIEFDREWSSLLATDARRRRRAGSRGDAELFRRHGRYTAGTATHYGASLLTGEQQSPAPGRGGGCRQALPLRAGDPVADAKPVQLGHVVKADGRFRIFAFAGAEDTGAANSGIRKLCDFLANDKDSPVLKYTRKGEDIDATIDFCTVFQQAHRDLAIGAMPDMLLPRKGCFGLQDYEKIFCADIKSGKDVFDMRGIDRKKGCIVVVRPDQYVAQVLPLDGYAQLAAYFDGFMLKQSN